MFRFINSRSACISGLVLPLPMIEESSAVIFFSRIIVKNYFLSYCRFGFSHPPDSPPQEYYSNRVEGPLISITVSIHIASNIWRMFCGYARRLPALSIPPAHQARQPRAEQQERARFRHRIHIAIIQGHRKQGHSEGL